MVQVLFMLSGRVIIALSSDVQSLIKVHGCFDV